MNLKSFIYSYQLRLRQQLAARSCVSRPNPTDRASFAPAKVLFVLAGLIGDSVMSISAIEAARRLWPKAKITLLGKKHNHELIAACDFFDEFYEFNADPFSLRRSDETRKLESWLAGQNFDAAIILLGDQFAHLLARADIPVRVGVKGTLLENCLTHLYDIGSPRTWGVNERLNAIRCLGYEVDYVVPTLKIDRDACAAAKKKLGELGLNDEEYIVLHPFGSTKRQWWNVDQLPEFVAAVKDKHNLSTVLVGGPDANNSINDELSTHAVNSIARLSLKELLAVIAGSRLVVTTDSGPFHIAGALQKPTVGLFRTRRPEHAEAYPNGEVVFGQNEKCMQKCEWDRCDASPCRQMSQISLKEVLAAVDSRL